MQTNLELSAVQFAGEQMSGERAEVISARSLHATTELFHVMFISAIQSQMFFQSPPPLVNTKTTVWRSLLLHLLFHHKYQQQWLFSFLSRGNNILLIHLPVARYLSDILFPSFRPLFTQLATEMLFHCPGRLGEAERHDREAMKASAPTY